MAVGAVEAAVVRAAGAENTRVAVEGCAVVVLALATVEVAVAVAARAASAMAMGAVVARVEGGEEQEVAVAAKPHGIAPLEVRASLSRSMETAARGDPHKPASICK